MVAGMESFSSPRRARCIIIKRGDGDCHNGQLLSAESARTEGQLAVSAGDLMPCRLLAGAARKDDQTASQQRAVSLFFITTL